jgi:hypothetical protein
MTEESECNEIEDARSSHDQMIDVAFQCQSRTKGYHRRKEVGVKGGQAWRERRYSSRPHAAEDKGEHHWLCLARGRVEHQACGAPEHTTATRTDDCKKDSSPVVPTSFVTNEKNPPHNDHKQEQRPPGGNSAGRVRSEENTRDKCAVDEICYKHDGRHRKKKLQQFALKILVEASLLGTYGRVEGWIQPRAPAVPDRASPDAAVF